MAQSRGSTDDDADSVAMASHPTATASPAGRMLGAVASFRRRSVPSAHPSAWSHRQGSTRRNAGSSAATGSTCPTPAGACRRPQASTLTMRSIPFTPSEGDGALVFCPVFVICPVVWLRPWKKSNERPDLAPALLAVRLCTGPLLGATSGRSRPCFRRLSEEGGHAANGPVTGHPESEARAGV